MPTLPLTTPAALLLTFGLLLGVSVLFSRAGTRTGVPLTLVFLCIGMLAGAEGIGRIEFADYEIALWLGTIALAFILFDGGLNTTMGSVRGVLAPSAMLATVGVVTTAALMATAAHVFGLPWSTAWLIGAIVSSTDAAAVFSVLRASGVHLKRRVGLTLEVESGVNDPIAFILTAVVVQVVIGTTELSIWRTALAVGLQLAIGAAAGVVIGRLARDMLQRFPIRPSGLVPAFTIAAASLAFAIPALLKGSGLLSVYIAGIVIGADRLPYKLSVLRVHDTLAWLSQIAMFLLLGLLAYPSRIAKVWAIGLGLALGLALYARPLAVVLCLVPFGYRPREVAFVGWVGLRGAVPIVLATLPVIMQVPNATRIFDVVFVIVVVNAALQGTSVPWVAKWLRVDSAEPPSAPALLEFEGQSPFESDIRSYYLDDALPVCGSHLADVPLPSSTSAILVIRGPKLLTPADAIGLEAGDHVYLLVPPADAALVQLLFGQPESS